VSYTPDGYYTGSAGVPRFLQWRVGEELFPAQRHEKAQRRPDLVAKALVGAK